MAEIKIQDAPQSIRAFYDKGIAAMERSNLDYAMDMFEAVLQGEPRLLETRQLLRAAAVQKYKDNPPGKMAALRGMAGLVKATALLKKEPLKALQEAEKLMRTDPFNMKYVKLLCDAAMAAELSEAAIQTLEILNGHSPDNLAVLEPLAQFYHDTRQYPLEYNCRNRISTLKLGDTAALKALKDAAARNTMESAGWENAGSYRDLVADGDKINGDS